MIESDHCNSILPYFFGGAFLGPYCMDPNDFADPRCIKPGRFSQPNCRSSNQGIAKRQGPCNDNGSMHQWNGWCFPMFLPRSLLSHPTQLAVSLSDRKHLHTSNHRQIWWCRLTSIGPTTLWGETHILPWCYSWTPILSFQKVCVSWPKLPLFVCPPGYSPRRADTWPDDYQIWLRQFACPHHQFVTLLPSVPWSDGGAHSQPCHVCSSQPSWLPKVHYWRWPKGRRRNGSIILQRSSEESLHRKLVFTGHRLRRPPGRFLHLPLQS